MNNFVKSLAWASVLNLLGNSLGTVIALNQHLAAGLGSVPNSSSILRDFLGFKGTALSAPLSFMAVQLLLTLFALRPAPLEKIGIVGLTFLGLFFTLAQAGEPILLRQFSGAGFNFMQSMILVINIASSLGMLLFGIRTWLATRVSR